LQQPKDPIILSIEGKWLKVVVHMSKINFFYSTMSNIGLAPYQKHITGQIPFISYFSTCGF